MPTDTTVADLRAELETWFTRLTEGDADDPFAGAELFHDSFLSLDPRGVAVVTREQLRAALPMRAELFRAAGLGDSRLVDLAPQQLDDRHVLAATTWEMAATDGRAPVRLASTYLLRREDEGWRVVTYLNHQDLPALLAAR